MENVLQPSGPDLNHVYQFLNFLSLHWFPLANNYIYMGQDLIKEDKNGQKCKIMI